MDPHLLDQYVIEVNTQCKFYFAAVRFLNHAQVFNTPGNTIEFLAIHSMLTHAGMISKLLWVPKGSRQRPKEDGEELRRALGMEDREWSLQSRALRDDLEHFDERIRKWHPEGGNIFDMCIGDQGAISAGSGVSIYFNRWFDPSTSVFEIRGTSINLQDLSEEVSELAEMSERRMRQRHYPDQL